MDHTRPQDATQSKDAKRLIRRVRSPSRPRAWLSDHYKPKFGGRFHKPNFPREEHSFYKPSQRYQHFPPRGSFHRRDHFHHAELRERERGNKERYEPRDADGGSPPHQSNAARALGSRPSSSREDVFTTERNQSREREPTRPRSNERDRSREGEAPPLSAAAARDRAIQRKRREIDEVYDQECEMFGLVAKMLISKDASLERSIQAALQENLRDIGSRCVEGMEKFIQEYDAREPPPR
ncbi:eukaryotic translation initiation factor 3 subunit A-like isoform X2 [Clinocottus analis]|uniref:eukaryotic translation initiation factor 3 subunit A-like isoform X2 n=1 Tax=Clinocottus analis TaxID=304258 RepID=UPI0035C21BB0